MSARARAIADRTARRLAIRRQGRHAEVLIGIDPTRRDLLAGAAVAAAALVLPRVAHPPAAGAKGVSCDSDCLAQARKALARADAACDRVANDLTDRYEFFIDPAFVRHQFRILCYQANQIAIQQRLAKCRFDCLSGKTSGQISAAKTTTVAPPKPPPPPSCPEGTFFCTVGSGGGDICCANGDSCCSCGICCVPVAKCACCGG